MFEPRPLFGQSPVPTGLWPDIWATKQRDHPQARAPARSTGHHASYLYWHTVAILTFRDLCLALSRNADQEASP